MTSTSSRRAAMRICHLRGGSVISAPEATRLAVIEKEYQALDRASSAAQKALTVATADAGAAGRKRGFHRAPGLHGG